MKKSKLLLGLLSLLAISVSSCSQAPSSSAPSSSETPSSSVPSSEEPSVPSSEDPSLPSEDPSSEEPPHVDPDHEKANEVIALIDALTSESTEEEIQEVIDAYNDLTERQKSFVTNYDKLEEYILKLEKLNAVRRVDAMIEALDEDNLILSEVQAARSAYNNLAIDYGLEWQSKVKQENVLKLERCEIRVASDAVNPIIERALEIDTSSNQGKVQFKLLSRRIESFLNGVSEHVLDALNNYEAYAEIYTVVQRTTTIAVENYINSTHCLPEDKKWAPMTIVEDNDFGYLSTEDLSMYGDIFEGTGNIQFATEVMTDFSMYKSIAFFASWPYVSTGLQFINDEVTAVNVTVPSVNEFVYVEIPVSSLGDKTGTNHSHIGAYLEDRALGALAGYKITAIVGIGIDEVLAQEAVDNVNAMIEALDEDNLTVEAVQAAREAYNQLAIDYSTEWQAKVKAENVAKLERCELVVRTLFIKDLIAEANTIELNSRENAARFTLLCNTIAEKYDAFTEEEKATINLEELAIKGSELDGKVGVLFDDGYEYGAGSGHIYTEVDDNNFGTMNTLSMATPLTNTIELDFNHENRLIGVDWSNYEHMGMFVRYDQPVTDHTYFIPNNWNQEWVPANEKLVDGTTNLYFYEFNLSTITDAFTAATYFQVYFGNALISKLEVTDLVFFNDYNPDTPVDPEPEDPEPEDPIPTVESYYNVSHTGPNYNTEGNWIWDDTNIVASKDDATGITNHTFTFTNTTEAFFQTVDTTSTVEEDTTYVVTVANNTDKTITVISTSRTWNSVEGTFNITLEVGQTAELLISSYVWNNTEKPDENKGYAVRIYSNGETFTGDVSVTNATIYTGELPTTPLVGSFEVGNLDSNLITVSKDETYGTVYTFNTNDIAGYTAGNGYPNIYLRDVLEVDTSLYNGVELYVYHETDTTIRFTAWSEDWNNHGPDAIDATSGVWNRMVISADTWNGDRNTCSVGFYDSIGLNGVVSIAVKGFVNEIDEPTEPDTPVDPEPEDPTPTVESYYNVSHHGSYDWIWDDTNVATSKDEANGVTNHTMTFNNTIEAFFQTVDTTTTVEDDHYVTVTNNTDKTLSIFATSRTWDSSEGVNSITLEAGQTDILVISSYVWNNTEKPEANKGFAIRLYSNGEMFTGDVTVTNAKVYDGSEEPEEPVIPEIPTVVESSYNVSHHGSYDWIWDDTNVNATKDNETGLVYHSKTFTDTEEAFFQTVDTTTRIGDNDVYEVVVKNNTNVALTFISTSRSWNAEEQTYSVTVEAGQTATLQISAYCWNNSTNGMSGYAIRVTNANGGTFSGEVVISNAYLVEQPTSLFGSITIPEVYKIY